MESYGYEEYDAPVLEPMEIYLAKTGDEIVNEQTYAFEDRGGRKVVIRPEMTPTVSRMVAGKRQELSYPLRWYSIPNLWRYERPQRGRLREHWQLNADIFGVKTAQAELEIITMVNAVFKKFGASIDMYEIRLNHRELTEEILTHHFGLNPSTKHQISKLIDRKHKLEKNDFIRMLDEILSDEERARGTTESILSILEIRDPKDLPESLRSSQSFKELGKLLSDLHDLGISNAKFDPTLMRGFDYYTGIIFETFDTHPENNRSMMGGGRYDGLVGLYGVEPVPTVGFGWGDVTLQNFLQIHSLMPELRPMTDAYVALIDLSYQTVYPTVEALRDQGLNLAVDISGRKLGAQLNAADKKGIRKVIILGSDELNSGNFKIKDLTTGQETIASRETIKEILRKN